jgi:putative peptide zinc metalloprotease protein
MDQVFIIGMLFGIIATIMSLAVPLGKGVNFVCTNSRLREVRYRALIACVCLGAVVTGTLFAPVPFRTRTEGVVWIPEDAFVRAGTDGFVYKVVALQGSWVNPGDELITCIDPELNAEVAKLEFRLQELNARHRQQYMENLVRAQVLLEQRRYVEEQLDHAHERKRELTIRSKNKGLFEVTDVADLGGRFLKKGEHIGYVVDTGSIVIRTLVAQDDIDLIRSELVSIEVRPAERVGKKFSARIKRMIPGANEELPSPVLSIEGGGEIPLDPREPKGRKALQKLFQVDLELMAASTTVNAGGRVLVRFDYGTRPLGLQLYRQVRQLFLSRFYV